MLNAVQRAVAAAALAALAGCAPTRPLLGFDELWMPSVLGQLPPGVVLDRVVVETQCVGISDVRHLPDGWSMRGSFDGENYRLEFTFAYSAEGRKRLTAADIAQMNQAVAALRVGVRWRGQWSDCANWTLSAHAYDSALPERAFEYRFERDSVDNVYDWQVAGKRP